MPAKKTTLSTKAGKTAKAVKKAPKKKSATKKVVKKNAKKTTKKVAKKAVKKTTKKVAKKATFKRVSCSSCTVTCDPSEAFWVNDGPILYSLKDLLEALESMTDEQYAHHAKQGENDFAKWVQHCIKDAGCATSLRRVKTRSGAVKILVSKCNPKK